MTRRMLRALAVAALTLLFMKVFGIVAFTPTMSRGLVRVADWCGVHGDEAIEDLYLSVTAAVSLVLALAVVGGPSLLRSRRRGTSMSGSRADRLGR